MDDDAFSCSTFKYAFILNHGLLVRDPTLSVVRADAERTPVWLMRQAGRYMAEFRKYDLCF